MTNEQQPESLYDAALKAQYVLEQMQGDDVEYVVDGLRKALRLEDAPQAGGPGEQHRRQYPNLSPEERANIAKRRRADFLDKLRDFESAGYHLLNAWLALADADNDTTMIPGYPFGASFDEVMAQFSGYRENMEIVFKGPAGVDH